MVTIRKRRPITHNLDTTKENHVAYVMLFGMPDVSAAPGKPGPQTVCTSRCAQEVSHAGQDTRHHARNSNKSHLKLRLEQPR